MFLVIFGRFSMIFDFFDPEYQYSYSKGQLCFNEKLWKPSFGHQTPISIFDFPNVRPRFRTSNQDVDRPAKISTVQPRFRSSSHSSPPSTHLTLAPDTEAVERAIRSFHRLSSGGPSGLRPSHLQEALRAELKDELLEHITNLVCLLVKGGASWELAPYLAGATPSALLKKRQQCQANRSWRKNSPTGSQVLVLRRA